MTPELKEKMLRSINTHEPYSQHNHLEICDVGPGTSRIELEIVPESLNRWGRPHGGVLFSLADDACGVAMTGLRQESCVTVSSNMEYIASAGDTGHLIARGRVVHAGRRTCFCQAEITTSEGKLIAVCNSVWAYTGKPLDFDRE